MDRNSLAEGRYLAIGFIALKTNEEGLFGILIYQT